MINFTLFTKRAWETWLVGWNGSICLVYKYLLAELKETLVLRLLGNYSSKASVSEVVQAYRRYLGICISAIHYVIIQNTRQTLFDTISLISFYHKSAGI